MTGRLPILAVVLTLAVSGPALATIGLAERHTELAYSRLASLHWIHPGDGCDCGRSCYMLVRRDGTARGFAGLTCSLRSINAPAASGRELVLAQCSCDGRFIVYDLQAERYLAQGVSFEQALSVWRAAGLPEPRLVDAASGARGLSRTWRSRFEEAAWVVMLWLPAVALPLVPLCLVGFVVLLIRFVRHRRGRDLAWGLLVLLPALPGLWMIWKVLSVTLLRSGR